MPAQPLDLRIPSPKHVNWTLDEFNQATVSMWRHVKLYFHTKHALAQAIKSLIRGHQNLTTTFFEAQEDTMTYPELVVFAGFVLEVFGV